MIDLPSPPPQVDADAVIAHLAASKPLAVISVLIIALFAATLFIMLFHPIALNDVEGRVLDVMVGFLGAAFMAVVNFWFGSSLGSHNKDIKAMADAPTSAK